MSDLRRRFHSRWDALKSVVYPENPECMTAHEPMIWDAAHVIERLTAENRELGLNVESLLSRIEQLKAENERLKAFIADRIHDATREEMLMEVSDE